MPRGHAGLPLPGVGLHLLGSAGRRHRPQRAHRVGHDQPAPRRHRLLPRAGLRRRPTCATAQRVPLEKRAGDPQGRGRRRRHDHGAQHRARPDHVRRLRIGRRGGRPRRRARGAPVQPVCRVAGLDGPHAGHRGRRDLRPQHGARAGTTSGRRRRSSRCPSQNLVYADTAGHIGYQTPGRIPVRRSATPGAPPGYWPAPGWDSQWDWKGWVPVEPTCPTSSTPTRASSSPPTRPSRRAPRPSSRRSGTTASARSASAPCSPPRRRSPRRTCRRSRATCATPTRPGLVERLLAVQVDDFTAQAQRLLRDWDGSQPNDKSRDSASAAYYNAVWKHLLDYTFDELPPDLAPDGGSRWMIVLEQLLERPQERVVGRQDDPRPHRGLRRDPQAGARRRPARPRPRARQGAGAVALGPAAPARPAPPGHGRRLAARGRAQHLQPRGHRARRRQLHRQRQLVERREARLRRHRRPVDADGRRPRRPRRARSGSTRRASPATPTTTTTPTRSTPGRRARASRGPSGRRRSARRRPTS